MLLGDEKTMAGEERPMIQKAEAVSILKDNYRPDLTGDDIAEGASSLKVCHG